MKEIKSILICIIFSIVFSALAKDQAPVQQPPLDAEIALWNLLIPPVDLTKKTPDDITTLESQIVKQVKAGADLLVSVSPVKTGAVQSVGVPITINMVNFIVKACTESLKENTSTYDAYKAIETLLGTVLDAVGAQKANQLLTTKDISGFSPWDLTKAFEHNPDLAISTYVVDTVLKPRLTVSGIKTGDGKTPK